MKCAHCLRDYPRAERRCPHCATPNPEAGYFQTSTVMISERGPHKVYRSVAEVPERLRNRLEQSTNGENSATILIADRRGHSEITKALRSSTNAAQRHLARAILGQTAPGLPNWLNRSPWRRTTVLAALLGFALAAVATVFTYHWK